MLESKPGDKKNQTLLHYFNYIIYYYYIYYLNFSRKKFSNFSPSDITREIKFLKEILKILLFKEKCAEKITF